MAKMVHPWSPRRARQLLRAAPQWIKYGSPIVLCMALVALVAYPLWGARAAQARSFHQVIPRVQAAATSSNGLPSDPAIARNADGRLEIFDRGPDGRVFHSWQLSRGGAWSAWTQLGSGTLLNNLAVGENADGRLEVFGVGLGGSLWHAWQECAGCGWSGWDNIGGVLTTSPVVGMNADGQMEVFGLGQDFALWTISQTCAGCGWTAWDSLEGGFTSTPAVGQVPGGSLEVFGRGEDGALYTKWQTSPSGTWTSNWTSLGGTLTSDPTVWTWQSGRMDIFARGVDGALWTVATCPGCGSSGWSSLGGGIVGDPTVGLNTTGQLEVFVAGQDYALWTISQVSAGSSTWTAWDSLGGGFTGNPAVGQNADGRLQVVEAGLNLGPWTTAQVTASGNWGGWAEISPGTGLAAASPPLTGLPSPAVSRTQQAATQQLALRTADLQRKAFVPQSACQEVMVNGQEISPFFGQVVQAYYLNSCLINDINLGLFWGGGVAGLAGGICGFLALIPCGGVGLGLAFVAAIYAPWLGWADAKCHGNGAFLEQNPFGGPYIVVPACSG